MTQIAFPKSFPSKVSKGDFIQVCINSITYTASIVEQDEKPGSCGIGISAAMGVISLGNIAGSWDIQMRPSLHVYDVANELLRDAIAPAEQKLSNMIAALNSWKPSV